MSTLTSISGFTPLTFSYSSSSVHYVYARAHESSKKAVQVWPEGRTLFLVNVPPDATEREISSLFKQHGTVERVVFDSDGVKSVDEEDLDSDSDVENEGIEQEPQTTEQPQHKRRRLNKIKPPQPPQVKDLPHPSIRILRKTGQSAHVVFLDSSSLTRALASSSKQRVWSTDEEEPLGFSHYITAYRARRPPLDAVREYADTSMELYEFEQAKLKQKSKYRKGEAIVDEDGFTLVTRGGAYGQTLGGGVSVASKRFQKNGETSRIRKKKDTKEKTDFYAFQKAEKQRGDLIKLKRDWEATKAQVEKLKASRKFKPY